MTGKVKAGAVAGMVLAGATLTVWAAELKLDQIPEKAKAALLKLAGEHKITEVEAEKEHGVQMFEASWRVNGKEVEAEVTAEGELLEMETAMAEAEVPEAVKQAAAKVLTGAAKIHYTKVTRVIYEVEGKVNGKKKEIEICPSGRIMGHEAEGDDGEDEDDEDEDDEK